MTNRRAFIASTTAALALGDALAVCLLESRQFSAADFARLHPGGTLGRRLLVHVRDLMRPRQDVPCVAPQAPFNQLLREMTHAHVNVTIQNNTQAQILLK